jgi:hypothetical protein
VQDLSIHNPWRLLVYALVSRPSPLLALKNDSNLGYLPSSLPQIGHLRLFIRFSRTRYYLIIDINLITANPIMAETIAIHTQMSTIENQNLCDKFRLGLRRSAILLELLVSVGREGRFRLIS